MKERLLFIDVLRILGITLIVLQHLTTSSFLPYLQQYYFEPNLYRIYWFTYGDIGVALFLFASGCSLALNDSIIDTKRQLKSFFGKRLLRIYPAYWTGLLFSIIMSYTIIPSLTVLDLVRAFSGLHTFFTPVFGQFFGKINGSYWFISLIISLYLLYPLLLKAIKKHPHLAILSFFIIDVVTRIIWVQMFPHLEGGFAWFPLCRLFEFSLGIYLVQVGFYPKKTNPNKVVSFGSNLTFYVWLIHTPLLILAYYNLTLFLLTTLVMATMLYMFDNAIKHFLQTAKGSRH